MNEPSHERLPGDWRYPNRDGVIELIRRFSVWGLGGHDGCPCCEFKVLGFNVSVSCRKSDHCVRVYSNCLWYDRSDDIAIAIEVLRQLDEPSGYEVRFCSYMTDHKKVCDYCGNPRTDESGYLCDACTVDPKARDYRIYTMPWRDSIGTIN